MKKLISALMAFCLSTALAQADVSHASLKLAKHKVQHHHAHKATKHHAPKRRQRSA